MGNCASCQFCTEKENETIYSSIRVSTNSILGGNSQTILLNSICCCKTQHLKNPILLDNIKLSTKEKKIFEKKISKISTKSKGIIKSINEDLSGRYSKIIRLNSDKLDLKDISLSISNRLFINKIENALEKNYKILNNLGSSTYGDVFLAYNIYTKEKVAIKKINKSNEELLSPEIILDEIEILKSLSHPDIVKIIEFYETKEAYYIVNEFCSGGELFEKALGNLSETQISVIFKQILSGLSYLHSKNIMHRDLKLENILISDREYLTITGEEYLDIKIIDFGNAIIFDKTLSNNSIVGSIYYIAPEVFLKKYSKECDLWSAGVILYMLIVGSPPFSGDSDKKIISKIKTGIYDKNIKRWINSSNEVKDLISKLLVYDPKKRLTAIEALQHPWFKKANSDILFYNIPKNEILHCIQNLLSYNIKSKFEELVLCYIIHNMSKPKEAKTAIKIFKLVNITGDGKLQKNELKKTLLYFVSEEYLQNFDKIFDLIDGENHGYIEYEEFLRAALDKKVILSEENIKNAFHFFDKDNNGFISKEQMKSFFKDPYINLNEQIYNHIFEEIDINRDGKIDFQEFRNMMIYD